MGVIEQLLMGKLRQNKLLQQALRSLLICRFGSHKFELARKQWEKEISKYMGKKPRVKFNILQDAKERGGLGVPKWSYIM